MPVQAIIEHGAHPDYDVTDETGVLVNKRSIKPTREYVERKNSQRMVAYVRVENPRISFEFSGIIVGDSATGFEDQSPAPPSPPWPISPDPSTALRPPTARSSTRIRPVN